MTETSPESQETEHAAMDRVRELHARDRASEAAARERPWWPRIVALVLALGVVGAVALGFDAFLTAVQRYLDTPVEEPKTSEESKTSTDDSIPVFVVPGDEPPESPAPAPDAAPGQD
jgi:hypothetical protein